MKNILLNIMWIIALAGGIFACNKYELGDPPASTQANFSYTLTNDGNAPCEMVLENISLNATGYFWDFGNGITSTEKDPTVAYDTPGLYTVTLRCTSDNDVYYNNLTKTVAVNIKDPLAGATQYYILQPELHQVVAFIL